MQEYHYVEYVSFKKISDEKQNSGFPKKTLKFLAIFRRHLGPVGRVRIMQWNDHPAE